MTYEIFIPIVGCILGLTALAMGINANRTKRLVDDVPTLTTTGVFIGLVELKGTAEAEEPLTSFLGEQPCVQYTYTVEEHWSRMVTETYTDSDGNEKTREKRESDWKVVDEGGESIPFYLRDEHGVILVRSEGAEIQAEQTFEYECGQAEPIYNEKGPPEVIENSDRRRRFRETVLPLHADLYIVGQAREREDIVAAEIAHDEHAPTFLISTKSEEEVSKGFWWAYVGWTFFGLLLCVGSFVYYDVERESSASPQVWLYGVVALIYIVLFMVTMVWMRFNSLIGLRHRVRQAWSLIDIQLKLRHDLIPKLVSIVSAVKEHEAELQTCISNLRQQEAITAPDDDDAEVRGVANDVTTAGDAVPELKANEAFVKLQETLVTTEQRIALARNYFNEMAGFYNGRLADQFLGKLAGLKPETLMEAADFERASVEVQLVE